MTFVFENQFDLVPTNENKNQKVGMKEHIKFPLIRKQKNLLDWKRRIQPRMVT